MSDVLEEDVFDLILLLHTLAVVVICLLHVRLFSNERSCNDNMVHWLNF